MSTQELFDSVIVLGGGPAGLTAAAAAAPYASEVHVLERDPLSHTADLGRRGVPQSAQLHNILARGQLELEALLPGFGGALRAAGGIESRVGADVTIFDFGRRLPRRDVGLSIISIWRPALERALRSRVTTEHPNVRVLDGCVVTKASGDPSAVDFIVAGGSTDELHGDLVIDARGAVTWERPFESTRPAETSVPLGRWYASAVLQRKDGEGCAMCFPTPSNSKGALLSPAGPDRWHVSVSGTTGDPPVRTMDDLNAHLTQLEDTHIAQTVHGCELVEPFALFRRPHARRVLPIIARGAEPIRVGDAEAMLSPLPGLGLSQAFAHAGALRSAFTTAHATGASRTTAAERATALISGISTHAWELSLLTDRPLVSALAHDTGCSLEAARQAVARMIDADESFHRLDSGLWHLMTPIEHAVSAELLAHARATLKAAGLT